MTTIQLHAAAFLGAILSANTLSNGSSDAPVTSAAPTRIFTLADAVQEAAKTQDAAKTAEGPKPEDIHVFWKDGLRFETADKRTKFRVGGRIHYDTAWFSPDDDTKNAVETGTTEIEDGSEFRRARMTFSGEVGDRVEWTSAVDFGGGVTSFRDMWMGVKGFSIGDVRVGQFKEPYGLEQITSSNNITFIERSLMNTFVPAFNAGIGALGRTTSERVTWGAGVFRQGSDNAEVSRGDGEYAVTARVTGLPSYSDDGRGLIHVGIGASARSPVNDAITYAAKPETNIAPNYLSLTNFPAEDIALAGLELAWVRGPFSLQGEYSMVKVDAIGAADPDFAGYYVQASWFLTGESRPYKKSNGCFDAIKPAHNAFGKDGGNGAWEIAARISGIDLVDASVDQGELTDVTLGVNWYLNPNARVMLNAIHADLEPAGGAPEGSTDILAMRFQLAF